jgi:hypothetical protein
MCPRWSPSAATLAVALAGNLATCQVRIINSDGEPPSEKWQAIKQYYCYVDRRRIEQWWAGERRRPRSATVDPPPEPEIKARRKGKKAKKKEKKKGKIGASDAGTAAAGKGSEGGKKAAAGGMTTLSGLGGLAALKKSLSK